MGDPLPCCAGDLLGGVHLLPPTSLKPASPLPETVLRSFSPLCPPEWRGGFSSCCFPLPLGGLSPLSRLCLLGGLVALGPYLQGTWEGLTSYHPTKMGGGLFGLGAWGHHFTLNSALGAADCLGRRALPHTSLVPSAASALRVCLGGAACPQG